MPVIGNVIALTVTSLYCIRKLGICTLRRISIDDNLASIFYLVASWVNCFFFQDFVCKCLPSQHKCNTHTNRGQINVFCYAGQVKNKQVLQKVSVGYIYELCLFANQITLKKETSPFSNQSLTIFIPSWWNDIIHKQTRNKTMAIDLIGTQSRSIFTIGCPLNTTGICDVLSCYPTCSNARDYFFKY